MADNLNNVPKFTWGTSFANTLTLGYPVDNPVAYPDPRPGSEVTITPAGGRDAWTTGIDEYLEFDVRWIPGVTTADPVATGWEGATGFAAFLDWARDMNLFRFYPDKDSGSYFTVYLVEPMSGAPGSEGDGSRRIHLKIVDSGGNQFTGYTFDPEP